MSKLPTEWDLLNKIWHIINQQVEEEILLSSDVQDEIEKHIESHTQAHTEGLREENARFKKAFADATAEKLALREELSKTDNDCSHLSAENSDLSSQIEGVRHDNKILRERVKELEEIIVGINSCQMVGITWPNELKQKVEKIWEALK